MLMTKCRELLYGIVNQHRVERRGMLWLGSLEMRSASRSGNMGARVNGLRIIARYEAGGLSGLWSLLDSPNRGGFFALNHTTR